jgi:multimeric flavodoxin WrbA
MKSLHGDEFMKIIGISASPKMEKSQTRRLVMGVLEGARQTGADVTFVDICSLEIKYCTACGTCYAKGECIHDDDFPIIMEKMLDADGIVWGSPNYINSVTAQLKTLLDRMADSIHCQSFTGKYGCAVCTAGGSMAEEVADYMNETMRNLGATTVGKVAVLLGADPDAIVPAEKQAKELGRKLADAIRAQWKDPAQEKYHKERREYFRRLVMFNKDLWKHEYDYWKATGELK